MSYETIYNKIGLNTEMKRLKNQACVNWKKELRTLKYYGLRDGMKILEVGSGPGFYSQLLLNEFPNIEITALELDSKLISISKKILENDEYYRVNFVNQSIEKTSLNSCTYDFVISRLVFQHLPHPVTAAQEIYRVLKPGGKVVILDIDNDIWGTTYPYNKFIDNANNSMLAFQNNNGGDRTIGRKLLKILSISGFHNLDFDAIVTHTDVIGMDKLIGQFNDSSLSKQKIQQNREMQDYINFINNPASCIILLMLIAYGEKSSAY